MVAYNGLTPRRAYLRCAGTGGVIRNTRHQSILVGARRKDCSLACRGCSKSDA